jgi:hypothetical protein
LKGGDNIKRKYELKRCDINASEFKDIISKSYITKTNSEYDMTNIEVFADYGHYIEDIYLSTFENKNDWVREMQFVKTGKELGLPADLHHLTFGATVDLWNYKTNEVIEIKTTTDKRHTMQTQFQNTMVNPVGNERHYLKRPTDNKTQLWYYMLGILKIPRKYIVPKTIIKNTNIIDFNDYVEEIRRYMEFKNTEVVLYNDNIKVIQQAEVVGFTELPTQLEKQLNEQEAKIKEIAEKVNDLTAEQQEEAKAVLKKISASFNKEEKKVKDNVKKVMTELVPSEVLEAEKQIKLQLKRVGEITAPIKQITTAIDEKQLKDLTEKVKSEFESEIQNYENLKDFVSFEKAVSYLDVKIQISKTTKSIIKDLKSELDKVAASFEMLQTLSNDPIIIEYFKDTLSFTAAQNKIQQIAEMKAQVEAEAKRQAEIKAANEAAKQQEVQIEEAPEEVREVQVLPEVQEVQETSTTKLLVEIETLKVEAFTKMLEAKGIKYEITKK